MQITGAGLNKTRTRMGNQKSSSCNARRSGIGKKKKEAQKEYVEMGDKEYVVVRGAKIAEGGFSIVYEARMKYLPRTDELYAKVEERRKKGDKRFNLVLKRIFVQDDSQMEEVRNEIRAMTKKKSGDKGDSAEESFLLPLLRSAILHTENPDCRVAWMLFPRGKCNLREYIERKRRIKEAEGVYLVLETEALHLFEMACRGIRALHGRKFAHLDVKPGNMLLSTCHKRKGTVLRIMDFGSATDAQRREVEDRKTAMMIQDMASRLCTAAFRAPELFDMDSPSIWDPTRSDVWSLGCSLFCIVFGRSPFERTPGGEVLRLAITNGRFRTPEDAKNSFSSLFLQLIRDVLRVSPEQRPTMDALLTQIDVVRAASLSPKKERKLAKKGEGVSSKAGAGRGDRVDASVPKKLPPATKTTETAAETAKRSNDEPPRTATSGKSVPPTSSPSVTEKDPKYAEDSDAARGEMTMASDM